MRTTFDAKGQEITAMRPAVTAVAIFSATHIGSAAAGRSQGCHPKSEHDRQRTAVPMRLLRSNQSTAFEEKPCAMLPLQMLVVLVARFSWRSARLSERAREVKIPINCTSARQ
jgi:hypothetical protein